MIATCHQVFSDFSSWLPPSYGCHSLVDQPGNADRINKGVHQKIDKQSDITVTGFNHSSNALKGDCDVCNGGSCCSRIHTGDWLRKSLLMIESLLWRWRYKLSWKKYLSTRSSSPWKAVNSRAELKPRTIAHSTNKFGRNPDEVRLDQRLLLNLVDGVNFRKRSAINYPLRRCASL